jgi:hypothetical protein
VSRQPDLGDALHSHQKALVKTVEGIEEVGASVGNAGLSHPAMLSAHHAVAAVNPDNGGVRNPELPPPVGH